MFDILKARKQLGISQAELAKHLGIARATVNRWERGRNKPSELVQIAVRGIMRNLIKQKGEKRK